MIFYDVSNAFSSVVKDAWTVQAIALVLVIDYSSSKRL
jgi:hypothetical protein